MGGEGPGEGSGYSEGGGGGVAHGIDIITAADYFSLGNRQQAYLDISKAVAAFERWVGWLKGFGVGGRGGRLFVSVGLFDDGVRVGSGLLVGNRVLGVVAFVSGCEVGVRRDIVPATTPTHGMKQMVAWVCHFATLRVR